MFDSHAGVVARPCAFRDCGDPTCHLCALARTSPALPVRAAAHATRISPTWLEAACQAVRLYAARHWGEAWLLEDARAFAESDAVNLAPPPDGRAWGYVARVLKAERCIRPDGYAPAKSSNGSPKVQWRSMR